MFMCRLTRMQETKAFSKKGKTERGMLGKLKVYDENNDNKVIFECFTIENQGKPTDDSGKDKPIMPREYTLSWTDTSKSVPSKYKGIEANGRNKCLWIHNPADDSFSKRRILIHIGNSAIDTLGCILLGKGFDKNSETITQSTVAIQEFFELVEKEGVENFILSISYDENFKGEK